MNYTSDHTSINQDFCEIPLFVVDLVNYLLYFTNKKGLNKFYKQNYDFV